MDIIKIKALVRKVLTGVNKIVPKYNQVIIEGFPNIEGSAIAVANYISSNYKVPVFYVVNDNLPDNPRDLLSDKVTLIKRYGSLTYYIKYMTSKYVFITHDTFISSPSKQQVIVNIWHGVLYKLVRKLLGGVGIPANITVGTSELTKDMFAKAFGVPEESVFVSGYPRNDFLVSAGNEKDTLKIGINADFGSFDKIIVWLPTYRKRILVENHVDGIEVGNPFYIKDFDVDHFNNMLKVHNALCIVKPHPYAPKYSSNDLHNVIFIDDKWLSDRNITLYHLLGCSDMLISDVSSVIIDYLLTDNPVICISTDMDTYKKTRGFYFDDIENWIPTEIVGSQEAFFDYLAALLKTRHDPHKEKREKLKTAFFSFHDASSTERLARRVLSEKLRCGLQ